MSDNPYNIPAEPERDRQGGGDDLPTYDDLLVQNGPNSRFGRWREWIEKRAAERYADLTEEAYKQRKAKGWGDGVEGEPALEGSVSSSQGLGAPIHLQLQTNFSSSSLRYAEPVETPPINLAPQPSIGEPILPSHLQLHQFGSRFLPHTTSPIRCLLPLLGGSLLLIGHDDGLSVMDMYPKEWNDFGLARKGPNDAEARPIWTGEGVFQMDILESESTGEGTPQGVVLALVGPESNSPKDQESVRSLRMYNLASLVSLAKYAVIQKPGKSPLDLRHPTSGRPTQQTSPRRHRKGPSLAKGFKSLMIDSPPTGPNAIYQARNEDAYVQLPSAVDSPASGSLLFSPSNDSTATLDSTWDMVDDLPLRWATDFVPLATAGSRLINTSVLSYAVHRDEHSRSRGGVYLAIAVKCNILLYETPKGERAFRFIKEFYTPVTARSLTFVHQTVHDVMSRSPSDITHSRQNHLSTPSHRHTKRLSMGSPSSHVQYPPQLSLFVVFEKKAGLIRIADSAVGEVELYDDTGGQGTLLSASVGSIGRKPRSSWDGKGFLRESKASWIPPVRIVVPGQTNADEGWTSPSQSMYLITRGKHSHILPFPLPANLPSIPPFRTFTWSFPPNHISTRICKPSTYALDGSSVAFLQVIAFGEEGVEIQEIPLSAITVNVGKGKGRAEEPVRATVDVGGDTGFLCLGGHWDDDPSQPHFLRSDSTTSNDSYLEDISSARTPTRMREREGIYGWVRKGAEDWRVFWVGGTGDRMDQ